MSGDNCPHCHQPVIVGRQAALMRGTIIAHKACHEEYKVAMRYCEQHPSLNYKQCLRVVRELTATPPIQ